jgi:hypothetical protein
MVTMSEKRAQSGTTATADAEKDKGDFSQQTVFALLSNYHRFVPFCLFFLSEQSRK